VCVCVEVCPGSTWATPPRALAHVCVGGVCVGVCVCVSRYSLGGLGSDTLPPPARSRARALSLSRTQLEV
jgi:chemotaxis receptor (MCP) glutamine deamidase CheD